MEKGYFQIYTGTGKGKTTAALGLAVRAAGAGFKIFVGQFIKSMEYHEVAIFRDRFPEVDWEIFGDEGCIINRECNARDRAAVRKGYDRAMEVLQSGDYDLVILDEIFIASHFNLLTEEDLAALAQERAPGTELVMTGRFAPASLVEEADLVTDMREVKHYYTDQGVLARDGIER